MIFCVRETKQDRRRRKRIAKRLLLKQRRTQMEWLALVNMILQILGPILQKWLESLLNRAAKDMPLAPHQYVSGAAAERNLWVAAERILDAERRVGVWWNPLTWGPAMADSRKRRYFDAARSAAKRREGQFYAAAQAGNPRLVMGLTPVETDEIRSAS